MKKRVWVNPNDSVDLQSSDIKLLGPNLRFMKKIIQKELNSLNKIESKNKKILTRVKNKKETIQESKDIRLELKTELENKNKDDIITFAEESLKMNIKLKNKKGILITKILLKARSLGYKNILKKIREQK